MSFLTKLATLLFYLVWFPIFLYFIYWAFFRGRIGPVWRWSLREEVNAIRRALNEEREN